MYAYTCILSSYAYCIGIAPGQFAAFYNDTTCLGAGVVLDTDIDVVNDNFRTYSNDDDDGAIDDDNDNHDDDIKSATFIKSNDITQQYIKNQIIELNEDIV